LVVDLRVDEDPVPRPEAVPDVLVLSVPLVVDDDPRMDSFLPDEEVPVLVSVPVPSPPPLRPVPEALPVLP